MKRQSTLEYNDLGLDLFFCAEVLKLPSLHYGLWETPDARPTLEGLRGAQQRYTEALYAMIPEGTRRVLDVGCGLGDVTRGLLARGMSVTALSPDVNHGRYLRQVGGDVRFVRARYQSFTTTERFDLVLMSESQNYFKPDIAFAQTSRHLRAGGHLLVSGMFRKPGAERFPDFVNALDEFLSQGAQTGFDLVEDVDVTAGAPPVSWASRGGSGASSPSSGLGEAAAAAGAGAGARVGAVSAVHAPASALGRSNPCPWAAPGGRSASASA